MTEQPAVVINFPRPPSANRMFARRMTRRGYRDLTPEYKAWRDEAGWLVKMQIVGLLTIATRFNIVVEVPRSRMDLDNHLKPILDLAQNMGIITNDRNCVGISITPADRFDCMAAFWPLDEVGIIAGKKRRAPMTASPRKRPGLTWKMPT